MHFLKTHSGSKSPRESLPEEKYLACLQKDSKDGDNLASCGSEFQSLGAATEKALSCESLTKRTCDSGGTDKGLSYDLKTRAGS